MQELLVHIHCSRYGIVGGLYDSERLVGIQATIELTQTKHQEEIQIAMTMFDEDKNNPDLHRKLKALQDESNFYLEMISVLKSEYKT